MKELKKEVEVLKKNLENIEAAVSRCFEERKLEMTYEIEKMRYENNFNAKNITYIILAILPFFMSIVFGYVIYKYFEFEKQNTQSYIEVENLSDNNSKLYNTINHRS